MLIFFFSPNPNARNIRYNLHVFAVDETTRLHKRREFRGFRIDPLHPLRPIFFGFRSKSSGNTLPTVADFRKPEIYCAIFCRGNVI